MSTKTFRAFLATGALAAACASWGCVADRPARNGVYNENQYVRKDFLIQSGNGTQADPGWMLKATVTQVSTPNPLGSSTYGIFSGTENGGSYVRFVVTQDKLQMVSQRAISNVPVAENTGTPEVVNSWSATNVDLKYRVNLDGEKTNFYEENQELDWQVRQWVKVAFDKNDMSDLAPFGSYESALLAKCTDAANYAVTLVPNSFNVDEPNNYIEWTVQITMPLNWADATCVQAFGVMADAAERLGRQSVTMNLKYSMVRADPNPTATYQPLVIAEKDPIRHKYGFFDWITAARDPQTGNLAAQQYVQRFNPDKPFVWYFAPGFPENYKTFFTGKGGVADQTNQLMKDSGAAATLQFLNWNDATTLGDGQGPNRQYGDVRYSFLRWMSDRDMQDGFAGVTQFVTDPRTGEILSSSISFNDFAIQDYYVQRIDAYLQSVGASAGVNSAAAWKTGSCKDGDTMPIVPATVASNHNGTSTLYQKMQQYLGKPASTFGNLGPQDFIQPHNDDKGDFYNAYFALLPYYVYADPDMNPFVIREGGQGVLGPASVWPMLEKETAFQKSAADIDRGIEPYKGVTGPMGIQAATQFLNTFKDQTLNHTQLTYLTPMLHKNMHMDPPTAFSFEQMISRDSQHCVADANGGAMHWETSTEWTNNLISTYWSQVAWHEFGHSLGLAHNFMASIDKNNFPHYKDATGRDHVGLYSNSVMEYNAAPDRIFWKEGWAPYDQGAISWLYANNKKIGDVGPYGKASTSISGEASPTAPWNDPHGFQADQKTEIQYLFCTHQHLKYTPFCRQGDSGTTPSEIIANAIDAYEWQYAWRNFRTYRKIWDNSAYANAPAAMITDLRKFISLWVFDWSSGELADSLRRIGISNPDPNGSQLEYYQQLTNKFNADVSSANQMVAAFHKAIIQESTGQRPYATKYDTFYGDTTQQGIILDKLFAMQGWVGLWPTDNYDQNQAGTYLASYSGIGDSSYAAVAEDAVDSMVGGQYDAYKYFVPLAVAQFAQDTHSPNFGGRTDVRDWVGGWTFTRLGDFLAFFRDIAARNSFPGCNTADTCTYDPRSVSDTHNEFFGPDHRLWIWAYVADRNTWVAVQKERNTASYIIVRNYTDDVIFQQDDGAFPGGAYAAELPMKFFLDSFQMYN